MESLIAKPIAIVGMSCRLPEADGIDALWDLLVEGRSAIGELPPDRLDQDLYFDPRKGIRGKTYSKLGGVVSDRPLDPTLVPHAQKEWDDYDECHWMLAEVAAKAWKHSGLRKQIDSRVGVYVGHSGGSRQAGELIYATLAEQTANILRTLERFRDLSTDHQRHVYSKLIELMRYGRVQRAEGGGPHLEASAAAKLIAKTLDLVGPQMVIDAACASSLTSLGLACLELQAGNVEAAIVAGASYNKSDSLVLFSNAQSCSATGSRPFDDQADGLISSEGYVVLVLKTLDKAIADGDRVWGVLKGLGMSTDGRGKSLWAPRREGQLLAVQRAYNEHVQPEHVQYVEAHATSTQIGDATELQALTDYFSSIAKDRRIPIGSIKSNIGHTLETAGLAGLMKVLLAMHHRVIPPTIHVQQLNRTIPWDQIPFDVVTSPRPWQAPANGRPRCGSVNAFGIGGLNVHLVVEEYPTTSQTNRPSGNRSQPAVTANAAPKEPIAIVGRGLIVPGATGIIEFESLLNSQRSSVALPPKDRWLNNTGVNPAASLPWQVPTNRGGYLLDYAYDWKKHRVPPKQVQNANPLQFMLLDAAGQAIEEANQGTIPLNTLRTSVVVGTVFGGEFGHQLQMGLRLVQLRRDLRDALHSARMSPTDVDDLLAGFERRFLEINPALLDETGSFTSSTLASRITKQYNLMGGAMAIDGGPSSCVASLLAGANMLRSGVSDAVICASGHRALDLPAYETLFAKGWLNEQSQPPRLPGEGVVVLVLKRVSDAVRDGNQIFGVIDSIDIAKDDGSRPSSDALIPQLTASARTGHLQSTQGFVDILEALTQYRSKHSHTRWVIPVPMDEHNHYRVHLRNSTQAPTVEIQPSAARPQTLTSMKPEPSPMIRRSHSQVAAIFTGQGSQDRGMIDRWLLASSSAKQTLEVANALLNDLHSPNFHQLLELARSATLTQSWPTQATTLIADVVLWNAWREFGVEPEAVAGHSLGELAALVAAESWSFESALSFVKHRASAVDQAQSLDGGLLSIPLPLDEVEDHIRTKAAMIFVTHQNSSRQTVVGGSRTNLLQLQATLQSKRIISTLLRVSAPFHTPLLSGAANQLAEVAAKVALRPPRIPFLSSVSNRFEADPESIRRNLIVQLISPVRYVELVHRLQTLGCNRMIEIGLGSVLTKLHGEIISDDSVSCIAMGNTDPELFWSQMEASSVQDSVRSSQTMATKSQRPSSSNQKSSEILVLDATSQRRSKNREQANQKQKVSSESFPEVAPSIETEPLTVAQSAPALYPTPANNYGPSELESFVRDLIVEQTGYPAEMIQLDWDLEVDLGIDSIKLVQLLGELREMFDLDPSLIAQANFRTLRDILDVLKDSGGKREWLETAPAVDSNRQAMTDFMIDFVIEHTGYPREIVDVTADLEADLGLDSIKLAQLFGELRSQFDIDFTADRSAKLSQVRSLQDVLELVSESPNRTTVPSPASFEASPSIEQSPPVSSDVDSYSRAFQQGERFAASIQQQLREDFAQRHLYDESLGSIRNLDMNPRQRRELDAIAEGAGIHVENLTGLLERHGRTATWAPVFEEFIELDTLPFHSEISKSELEIRSTTTFEDEVERSEAGPSSTENFVTQRYVLGMEDSPPIEGDSHPMRWRGPAVILGKNALAQSLQTQLQRQGVSCISLSMNDTLEAILEAFERFDNGQGVPHLFIASPFDADPSEKHEPDFDQLLSRQQTIQNIFWVCQRWMVSNQKAGKMDELSIGAFTRMGGSFGFDGKLEAPESGAVSGLVKAILIESWVNGHRGLPIKILDGSRKDRVEDLVESMLFELGNTSYDTEISWHGGRRRVVRARCTPANPSRTRLQSRRPKAGVWVCTGGGRGITALVASELAKRYELELHLLGKTPLGTTSERYRNLDEGGRRQLKNEVLEESRRTGQNSVRAWQAVEKQIEIDATLQQLRSQGIQAYYHCCDVSDARSTEICLENIRKKHGPIRGILHGAGVGQDSRFERKRPEKVSECYRAKIDGAIHLMRYTLKDPIEYFIGFGSISGRFGANGHTDYSSANEALAKYVGWYRRQRPEVHATTFHWHAWGDVGMAVKPETKLALEMIDMQFMPASEGIQHLIRELEVGMPEPEVLITDDRYYRMFFPAETISSSPAIQPAEADSVGSNWQQQTPLLETADSENVLHVRHSILDPIRDVFLREHRLQDRPLLPFVISLELMSEAAKSWQVPLRQTSGACELLIQQAEAVRGMKFDSDLPRTVTLTSPEADAHHVRLQAEIRNREGRLLDPAREFAKAKIQLGRFDKILDWNCPLVDSSSMSPVAYPDQGQEFYSGPAFRVLKRIRMEDGRLIGVIQSPSLIELVGSHRQTQGWMVPCAVLDACLFATGVLAWRQLRSGVSLPCSVESLRIARLPKPGETCRVEVRWKETSGRYALFDFCVWGKDDQIVLEAYNYRIVWLSTEP